MSVNPLANRLHHVGITVDDMERAIRFWTDLTGGTAGEVANSTRHTWPR